jgi:putative hydrolase of the HAD superfamily
MTEINAVVFDLYGTLIEDFPFDRLQDVLGVIARQFGIDEEIYRKEWERIYPAHELGEPPSTRELIFQTCEQLGINPSDCSVSAASSTIERFFASTLIPRDESYETLRLLKSRSIGIGMVSNAPPGVPEVWYNMALSGFVDVSVFSCEVKVKKPSREIYELVARNLKVPTNAVLFVGDGGNYELRGAREAGMKAMLLSVHNGEWLDPYGLFEEARTWAGLIIRDLQQVFDHLGENAK